MSWKPVRVLFIGDEPSSRNVDENIPFVGTPSYKRLLRWIGELDLDIRNVGLINAKNVNFINIRNYDRVVVLGKKTEKNVNVKTHLGPVILTEKTKDIDLVSLQMMGILEFTLYNGKKPEILQTVISKTIDHPSPRNRNFNDPVYEKKMLKELKRWLYE